MLLAFALETFIKHNEINIYDQNEDDHTSSSNSMSILFVMTILENLLVFFILVIPTSHIFTRIIQKSLKNKNGSSTHLNTSDNNTISKLFLAQVLPSLFYVFTFMIQMIWENNNNDYDKNNTIRILSLLYTFMFRWVACQVIFERQIVLLFANKEKTLLVVLYILSGICAFYPLLVDYSCFKRFSYIYYSFASF